MSAFIDENRDSYGVEPICDVIEIAPSTYYAHKVCQRDPGRRSARAQRDEELCVEIERVYGENFSVYGVRKVWRQLNREGITAARCTVARLMKQLGLEGATRGKPYKTTTSSGSEVRPPDLVERDFTATAPNGLWVSDLERHEAFPNRAVVKGHGLRLVAAGRFEAEGSLNRETPGRVDSSPDKAGTG